MSTCVYLFLNKYLLDQMDAGQREGCHSHNRKINEMERQSQEGSGKG